jgi:hypothetical protein
MSPPLETTHESSYLSARVAKPQDELLPQTVKWMESLGDDTRPKEIPTVYPRIANALCRLWNTPKACLTYLDELLIDRRGGRTGFPGGIVLEIASLKDHYETAVHPSMQTTWDHIKAAGH